MHSPTFASRGYWALVVLLIAGSALWTSSAQTNWPLLGQGRPLSQQRQVTLSVFSETIKSINVHRNSWEGVHWFYLQWPDPSAQALAEASTAAWASTGQCSLPCDSSGQMAAGCCDDVWLPSLELPNLVGIPEGSVARHRIWFEPPASSTPGLVHWAVRIIAEWQSPFDFRAWPFEHQHLLLEVQVNPSLANTVSLVFGDVKQLNNTPHTKGQDAPGWHIAKVTKRVFDTRRCFADSAATSSLFVIAGANNSQLTLAALRPADWVNTTVPGAAYTTLPAGQCSPGITPHLGFGAHGTPEAVAQFAPQVLVVDVMVKRTRAYYILANIVPLLLIDYMVFVVYAMDRTNLESRMGVVVTMVLALSALQFVYDFPPAQYLNTVQQLTLASFCLYFLVAIESMLASHICRIHSRRRAMARIRAAAADAAAAASGKALMTPQFSAVSGDATATLSMPGGVNGGRPSQASLDAGPSTGFESMAVRGSTGGGVGGLFRKQNSSAVPGAYYGMPSVNASDTATHTDTGAGTGALIAGDAAMRFAANALAGAGAKNRAAAGEQQMVATAGRRASAGANIPTPPGPVDSNLWQGGSVNPAAWRRASGSAAPPINSATSTGTPFGTVSAQHRSNAVSMEEGHPIAEGTASGEVQLQGRRSSATGGAGAGVGAGSKWGVARMKVLGGASARFVTRGMSMTIRQPRVLTRRIDQDEAFAQLFAARMDTIFSWFLLVGFSVVVAVLMYINTQVGDHKLMMYGSAPANM